MSYWPSKKGRQVYKALLSIGWQEKPTEKKGSSHKQLIHPTLPEFTWAFADSEEIGPKMMARIAKKTGLKPSDL